MSISKHTGLSPEALRQTMPFLSESCTVWVAYSGGCDSHVLLHLLAKLRQQQSYELKAVHVNHGLSPHAAEWSVHCQQVCNDLNVDFVSLEVDARPAKGESPEAVARILRYQAIENNLCAGDYLCTAHHQDDQAETLLLQLLRGAGPKGLAGMPHLSRLGDATQLRPLLDTSQAQIRAYAKQQNLEWVDDESNTDTGVNRNYLRHEIMPRLRQRWPAVDRTISRSANNCAEAAELIEVLAQQDYQQVKVDGSSELHISKLLMLDKARLNNVLRYWIRLMGLPLPADNKLQHIIRDVLHAAGDKMPLVRWRGAETRRFGDSLYVMPTLPEFDVTQVLTWDDLSQPLALPDGSLLSYEKNDSSPGLDLGVCEGRITVRFRQGGELIKPATCAYHKSLKQVFQENAIPSWLRNRIPLVYVGDQLHIVAGICHSDTVNTNRCAYQLNFIRH